MKPAFPLLGAPPLGQAWLLPAGISAGLACFLSLVNILMHFKNYRRPSAQRLTCRIIFMIPIFATAAWVSLAFPETAFLLDAVREIYEAFVVYCFFNLLVMYLGGEREMLILLHNRPPVPYVFPVSLWQKYMDLGDPYTFLKLKRGVLHFIYIKPACAVLTMLLTVMSDHYEGFDAGVGHALLSVVYNISYSTCLWCLSMFFIATKADLQPYRAVPKFLCIKAVIFFSFWQGAVISILVHFGIIHNTEVFSADHIATAVQDFLLCMEVLPASIGHLMSFQASDYRPKPGYASGRMSMYTAARDACGWVDVWRDTVDTVTGGDFSYRTYEPAEGVAGTARTRIASGLRYVEGGKRKYWLEEGGGASREEERERAKEIARVERERAREYGWNVEEEGEGEGEEDMGFGLDAGMEEGYAEARGMIYGDFNCPILDEPPIGVREGGRSLVREEGPGRRGRKGKGRGRGRGGGGRGPSRSRSPMPQAQGRTSLGVYDEESSLLHPQW